MIFSAVKSFEERGNGDLLVIPFVSEKKKAKLFGAVKKLPKEVELPVDLHDFKGKEGELLFLYPHGTPRDSKEKRIALLGLGELDSLTPEKYRRAFSTLTKACLGKKLKQLNVVLPSKIDKGALRGLIEGILSSNYTYDQLKSKGEKHEPAVFVEKVHLVGAQKADVELAHSLESIYDGVYLARDLVNGNADDVTPQFLCKVARGFAHEFSHVKTTVLEKKQLEKENMGLLLAVGRGSSVDPALIVIEYKGNAKSKDLTALVGKGVTYDTGGLNLKPTGSMETMKCDMGGAAAVLGTLYAVMKLQLPVNIVGVIPTTENSISGHSFKPGDVYTSHSGKTVEIGNTDAEGRLILADAISYTLKHYKPTRMIDLATLTGAIDIALGSEASGLFSNDDKLAKELIKAGEHTYERLWRMPLYEEYRDQLKSDIADIKNIGGRSGGSCTAAKFLEEFVGKEIPWAHLDIASTAYYNEAKRYHPKFGSGVGVRLLTELFQ